MSTIVNNELSGLYPGQAFNPQEIVPDALINQITASTLLDPGGDDSLVQVPYLGEDPDAGFVKEGMPVPIAEAGINQVSIHTAKIALLNYISTEAYGFSSASTKVAQSLSRAIIKAADNSLLNATIQASAAYGPYGLTTVTKDDQGNKPLTGTVTNGLDPISDALVQLQANGATPTHIVMDPLSWGSLSKQKYQDGTYVFGSPTNSLVRTLFGVPVLISNAMGKGSMIIVDSGDILSVMNQIAVSTSFSPENDSYAILATWRIGWSPLHVNRIARLTIDLGTGK